MSFTFTWLGHGSMSLEIDGKKILVDPFLTNNPAASAQAKDLEADFILISHGHGDHIGDSVDVAKRTNASPMRKFHPGSRIKDLKRMPNISEGASIIPLVTLN
jgi:L-ascorbate metabolism protein UlaG (beta-lactamase superfamily)